MIEKDIKNLDIALNKVTKKVNALYLDVKSIFENTNKKVNILENHIKEIKLIVGDLNQISRVK